MADWVTISSLATAGGTLVLAVASFASIRSADRAAQSAERAVQASLRPVLISSRVPDPQRRPGLVLRGRPRLAPRPPGPALARRAGVEFRSYPWIYRRQTPQIGRSSRPIITVVHQARRIHLTAHWPGHTFTPLNGHEN